MRRTAAEKGLPIDATTLTIVSVGDGTPDKNGPWLLIKCSHTPEWLNGRPDYGFNFKVRPETLWEMR
jgi:hypothetical protein